MQKNLIKKIDLCKIEIYRDNIINLIDYCWMLENLLGEESRSNYDDINHGTNGFEQLRTLIDSANTALMTINEIIFEIKNQHHGYTAERRCIKHYKSKFPSGE